MPLRRPSNSLLASIAVHIVVVALFVQALVMRLPLLAFLGYGHEPPVGPVERIGFLQLPTATAAHPATAGRRGGNGRPEQGAPQQPLIAPRTVPSAPPHAPPRGGQAVTPAEPGTGPLVGGGGPLRGIQPRYNDPRVWGNPTAVATAPTVPKTPAQRLDSVITSDVRAHNDSMRVAAGSHRAPGDWTVERNGQKYGIDSKYIHLGPVSIPTAILAMLPINVANNPTVSQRERTFTAMHDEIFSQAQRAMNEADFEKAVRSIRERKDRERREREEAKRKAADSSSAATPPAPTPSAQ